MNKTAATTQEAHLPSITVRGVALDGGMSGKARIQHIIHLVTSLLGWLLSLEKQIAAEVERDTANLRNRLTASDQEITKLKEERALELSARHRRYSDAVADRKSSNSMAQYGFVFFEHSSFIKSLEYNSSTWEMTVVLQDGFRSSRKYTYTGVPLQLVLEFAKADSAGSYYNSYIKNRYQVRP
jgi:cell division protein FtsB